MEQETPNIPILSAAAIEDREMTPEELKEELRKSKPLLTTVLVDKETGCPSEKKYQVIFVDEYNNFYLVGFYSNLEDAEKDVNPYLEMYTLCDDDGAATDNVPHFGLGDEPGCLGRLTEYASTFSTCFDRVIDVDCGCVQVRGFVFGGISDGE